MNNINSEDVDVNVCERTWPLSCGDSMFIQPDPRFTSHQSSIFTVQKCTIGLFISVSNTHVHEETRASVSIYTHTRILSTAWRHGAPDSPLLQTYVQQTELGARVCHPSCCLRPFLNGSNRRSRTHIHDHEHTH